MLEVVGRKQRSPTLAQEESLAAIGEHRLSHLQSLGDTGTAHMLPKSNTLSTEPVQSWDHVSGLLTLSLAGRQKPHRVCKGGTGVTDLCIAV